VTRFEKSDQGTSITGSARQPDPEKKKMVAFQNFGQGNPKVQLRPKLKEIHKRSCKEGGAKIGNGRKKGKPKHQADRIKGGGLGGGKRVVGDQQRRGGPLSSRKRDTPNEAVRKARTFSV